jgi:hypothetical protein
VLCGRKNSQTDETNKNERISNRISVISEWIHRQAPDPKKDEWLRGAIDSRSSRYANLHADLETALACFATSKLGGIAVRLNVSSQIIAVAQKSKPGNWLIVAVKGAAAQKILIRRRRASQEQTPGK